MRLGTQLNLGFLFLAVLPPTGMTFYSYATSQRAYRGAVRAEGLRFAQEMSSHLEQAVQELSARIEDLRRHSVPQTSSAFQKARETALAAAQGEALRSLLKDVLSTTRREENQIPFALDPDNVLYAAEPADLVRLKDLGLARVPRGAEAAPTDPNDWVIASQRDAQSGVTVGVARPLGSAVKEIRRTAVWNLAWGLGVVGLALVGIVPLTHTLTRQLGELTQGVERLGRGETDVQIEVPRGAEELQRLAMTFNHMARELQKQQGRLLAEERLHKELEISRTIQEALIPRGPARFPFADAAGVSIPAREVGGDFFNYLALSPDHTAILVGDVSGKGVPAAILMANIQATLSALLPLEADLAGLADKLDRQLGVHGAAPLYLTLFVGVLDGPAGTLRYVSAGHNTQILRRRGGALEPLESTGRPLGLLPGGGYEERRLRVSVGDALLLYTDGLPDAENAAGEPFGVERIETLVGAHGEGFVAAILGRVEEALRSHRGAAEAGDDATVVALQVSVPARD